MRLALLSFLLLAVAGCDALSDTVDEAACRASGYAGTGTVAATAAGSRFSATCVRGDVRQGVLTVTGIDNVVSANNQRSITLAVPAEAGTYDDVQGEALYIARTADAGDQADETFVGVGGTVTVESVSSTAAEGTFSFSARNPAGTEVVVTNGRFDVTF